MIARIVSGGQTGVDRAALDFAIEAGLEYGGWCPRGGRAEDRADLLALYPVLRATPGDDPAQRTEWNVRDSDATLVITRTGVGSPGTDLATAVARKLGKALTVIEPGELPDGLALGGVLNVAGPRESEAPGIYAEARELLRQAWRRSGGTSPT